MILLFGDSQESVGLRLTWMYDLPSSSMKLNSNILVNIQKAYKEGNHIKAAIHEYRGVTNVNSTMKQIFFTHKLMILQIKALPLHLIISYH